MTKKVSINNLQEYAQRILEEKPVNSIDDEIVTVSLTRCTAEWILTDLEKRGKRLLQSVNEQNTLERKREKRRTELDMLAVAAAAFSEALQNQKQN